MFLDRDGKHFRHILNWLRDGVVPTLEDVEYTELLREAEYYQLLVSTVYFFSFFSLFPLHSSSCMSVLFIGTLINNWIRRSHAAANVDHSIGSDDLHFNCVLGLFCKDRLILIVSAIA